MKRITGREKSGACIASNHLFLPLRSRFSSLIALASFVFLSLALFSPNILQAQTDTGLRSPTANGAETPSAGDNNGYEGSPNSAQADDTAYATDTNSGTNTVNSCVNAGKDKHRFYNYGISIPSESTINGVEVRLIARADSTTGSPRICVQLSWDGGANWTTEQSTPTLTTSTTPATYTLGGATNTWGRTWSVNDFSNTNFRVRLINVATNNSRDFTLDWVAVRVYYSAPTPPTITSTPVTAANVGQAYSYQATATGTAPMTWSLVSGPSGMTIGATTGLVTWTPGVAGSFQITIRATNSLGSADQSYTVTVSTPADTGLRSPTANGAETTSAGDNNGYQTSAANAHTDDTANAVDTDSGTNTSTSCTDAGKDKHRFYNYGFSIPGGSTINGIEVRLDARADSTSGSPRICVQLSWDGGTTWTTAKTSANLTTSLATYTLGSATDAWGRTWNVNDFSDANFRVRLIDVASSTARDFTLDWVAVRIHYALPLLPAVLTLTKSGTGTGTVTSSPAGINCGATCSASFTSGTPVTLTATATSGSAFAGFSGGGCGATSPCTVTLSTDTTVTATFNDTQAPTAPSGLNATAAGSSRIDLSWTASTDNMNVGGYWVERCPVSSCTYSRVNTSLVTGTNYNDTTGLVAGTAYSYRVQAADPAGNLSTYSNSANATTILLAPTGLTAIDKPADQGGAINLTWILSGSANVTEQRVYRSTSAGGPYNLVSTLANTVTSTTDTGVTNGTIYYYVVRAYNGTIESSNSNEASGMPLDNRPNMSALSPTSGRVGTTVTLSGSQFGATQGSGTVTFNGTAATPSSWSATSIVVPVPSGATTGPVIVTVGGLASNGVPFTLTSELTGTVSRTTDGAPLNGALVEVLQGGQVIASTITSGGGSYLLTALAGGVYALRTSQAGYETAQQSGISLPEGTATTVNVALTPTDTVAPAITITFPGDQAQLDVKTVTVSGTIDDPTSTVTVNGVTAEISSGLYSAAGILLLPGQNDLTIRAVDPFGNSTTQIRTVFLEAIPPVVQITSPAAGAVLSVPTVTVTGTIDDPTAPVTVNGVTATVNGNQFTVTDLPAPEGALILTARAEDPAGNIATDARTVTIDRTPPTVALSVPSEIGAGQNVAVHLEATDNLGLREIALSVGGQAVASFDSSPANFTYTVPPDTPVGTVLSLLGQAVDGAGLTQGQGGSVLVNVPTQAPGFAQGRVLDDALGLPLTGVTVTLDAETQVSDAEGSYLFNRLGGPILLSFTKGGYTEVERSGEIPPGQKVTLLDARLTPIDPKDNQMGASGGRGSNTPGTVFLEIPAGALASNHSVRITEIGNQGLINRLPLGWSPVAAVDLGVAGQAAGFSINGVLTFPNRLGLSAGSTVVAAQYDRAAHAWRAISPGTVVVDGRAITLSAPQTGQYLLLVADAGATAPPSPVVNALLEGASVSPIPNIQVTGAIIPKATVPGGPVQGVGEVVVTADQAVASGLRLSAKVAEQFDLRDQTQRLLDFTQDLIVYLWPTSSSAPPPPAVRLATKFPITPSQTLTLSELALGKVTVDFTLPPQDRAGSLVGAAGGTLEGSDGLLVSIPSGALASETLARVEGVSASSLSLPTGWVLVRSVLLDLTQATLTQSAQISLPTPAGLAPNRPILIGRITNIQGERGLKLVAFGKISGSLLVSTPTLYGMGLSGIRQGGEYLLVQPTGDVGFVSGVVSGTNGSSKSGVRVKGLEGPFFDLTASDGLYRLALFTGSRLLTAQDLASAQQATQTVTLAANQTITQNLPLASVLFAVTSVTPANGAQIVPLDSPVVVQFNRAVSSVSLTAVSVQLLEGATPVETVLVRSGSGVSLYPRALKSATTYTVALSTGITDLYGNPLPVPVTANFTTKSTVPPTIPPAGQITVSFPDASGLVTISATQGTIATENHLDLFNSTTGMTVSVDLQGNGSFSGQIKAELGDELRLLVRDPSGNVTLADPGPYRDADGTTLVPTAGGRVRGEGNTALQIFPGALNFSETVLVTPKTEAELPLPVPEQLLFGGAVEIDIQALLKNPARLFVPLPTNLPEGSVPFLVKAEEINGETVYEIVDSAKIENGQVRTSSFPFPGLLSPGLYSFMVWPPTIVPIVIEGTVFRDKDGNLLLDFADANGNDRFDRGETTTDILVPGAVVSARGPFLGVYPNLIARSDDQGHFAIVASVMPSAIGSGSTYEITLTAIDPLTQGSKQIALVQPSTSLTAGITASINFPISVLTTDVPSDAASPTIRMTLSGEQYLSGVAEPGSTVQISVIVEDDTGIDTRTLRLAINGEVKSLTAPAPPTKNPYTAAFTPAAAGTYNVLASVKDIFGKEAAVQRSFMVMAGGQIPQSKPGPPQLVTADISPYEGEEEVNVDATFRIKFDEPVLNADASTIKLIEKATSREVAIDTVASLNSNGMVVQIVPRRNLKFSEIDSMTGQQRLTEYELTVSPDIEDQDHERLGVGFTRIFSTFTLKPSDFPYTIARPSDEALLGDTLFIADNQEGSPLVRIIDLSDSDHPRPISTLPISQGRLYGIAASSDFFYSSVGVGSIAAVATYNPMTGIGTIQILDVSNLAAPRHIRGAILTQEFSGVPFRVKIVGKYAIVATLLQGIQIVDLEKAVDPNRSVTESAVVFGYPKASLGGDPMGVDMVGGKVYVLSRTQLTILDAGAFPTLSPSRTIPLPNGGFRMQILPAFTFKDRAGIQHTQDLAIIAAGSGGLIQIYNVSDTPEATDPPMPVSFALGGAATREMAVHQDMKILFVNSNSQDSRNVSNDVHIVDLKRPLEPVDINDPNTPLVLGKIRNNIMSAHVVDERRNVFATVAEGTGPGSGNSKKFKDGCDENQPEPTVRILTKSPVSVGVTQYADVTALGCPKGGTFTWTLQNSGIADFAPRTNRNTVKIYGKARGTTELEVSYTDRNGVTSRVPARVVVDVFEVAMKLEKVGPTVISTDRKYTEDATIRVTAVRNDTGAPYPDFKGDVIIGEETSIYSQVGGNLPNIVNIESGGTTTFVAKSLAGPKHEGIGGQKHEDAVIKTIFPPLYQAQTLAIIQWVDLNGNQKFDWVEAIVNDIYSDASGPRTDGLIDVLATVSGWSIDNTLQSNGTPAFGLVTKEARSTSHIRINPFFFRQRRSTPAENPRCGYHRPFGLRNTFIHEARHAYQNSLALPLEKDRDRDQLVRDIPVPPGRIFLDTTESRYVCDDATNVRYSRSYQGDDSGSLGFDHPFADPDPLKPGLGFTMHAFEEDAYAYAEGK